MKKQYRCIQYMHIQGNQIVFRENLEYHPISVIRAMGAPHFGDILESILEWFTILGETIIGEVLLQTVKILNNKSCQAFSTMANEIFISSLSYQTQATS